MIKLFSVQMDPAIKEPLNRVLQSGYIAQGRQVEDFELHLRPWTGRVPVTVNSGTSALTLALRLAGVGPGDRVISTPMTCAATNLPILTLGAEPVWADVDPRTGLIDPASVAERLEEFPNAKAVMAVDWGGQPADYDALRRVALPWNVPIIEDAAHAFGAWYKDRPVGSIYGVDYACFSFQAIKHLTTGDGGALTVPPEQVKRAKNLRWFGIDRDENIDGFRGGADIVEAGYKFHLNDIAAAIGIANLRWVGGNLERHRHAARFLNTQLSKYFTRTAPTYEHTGSWWMYTTLLPSESVREPFRKYMLDRGVEVSQVHWRNDRLAVMKPFARDLPGVDEFSSRMICLPTHCGPSWDVIAAANSFFEG